MPDAPDFFQYRLESNKNILGDMAELGARLGAVSTYDRGGTTLFADNFDNGLAPYSAQLGGTGAKAEIVSGTTHVSGYGVKLTAGSDGNHSAGILKRLQPQALSMMGFEVVFSLESNILFAVLSIQRNTATKLKQWVIDWETATGYLRVGTRSEGWVILATIPLPIDDEEIFHSMKVVIDLESDYYVRLMVDQNLYNLSAYQGGQEDEETNQRLEFYAANEGREGENDTMYLDEFIVTTDEIK